MEFRILGPVEVWEDGHPVSLGGGKQRAVLALLLLNANRIVSSDGLIDQLWNGQPPATAGTALQGHISSLRKALGADVIATRRPGYVLEADPAQIDLARFEQLQGEARRALERGDAGAGRTNSARRSGSGAAKRSRTSASSPRSRPRPLGWRICAWRRSRIASTPNWPSGAAPISSTSWNALSRQIRSGSTSGVS